MDQSDIVGPVDMLVPGSQQLLLVLAVVLAAAAVVGIIVSQAVRFRRRRKGAPRKRPLGTVVASSLLVAAVVLGVVNKPSPFFVPEFPALPRLFPDEAFFYANVAELPVDADSDRMIEAMGGLEVRPGASGEVVNNVVWGFPFNLVDNDTPRHEVSFTYAAKSDPGPYPITEPAYIQSMPYHGVDDHYVGIDLENRRMWELWATRRWFGSWQAGSGTEWDLDSLDFPKGGTTASGLPMFPLSYTWEEVDSGSIDHVIGAGSPVVRTEGFRWPAQSTDGPTEDPDAPPMGSLLRLRADVNIDALGPQARVIAVAMRDHGMVLADTAGTFSGWGTPDGRWDNADLATLSTLSTDDFEVVDPDSLMVRSDSLEAKPTAASAPNS